jgi:phage-related protein
MIEPLAELGGTITATVDGFSAFSQALPGMQALGPITEMMGQTVKNLGEVAGVATKGLSDLTAGMVRLTAGVGQSAVAQELASAAGNFFGNTLRGVQVTAGYLGGQFSRLLPSVSRFIGQGIQGLSRGFSMLGAYGRILGEVFRALASLVTQVIGALISVAYRLATTFASLANSTVKLAVQFVQGMLALPGKVGAAMSAGISGIGSMLAGPTLGLIQSALNPLNSLQGAIAPFIDALNPAMMGQLNTAFANLNAVIGRALVPIMGALIPIVRLFGDALVPVVDVFMPVAQQFADHLMSLATQVLPLFAGLLVAMADPLSMLIAALSQTTMILFDAFMPVLNAVVVLFQGVVEAITPLLPALAELVAALVALAMPIINFIIPPLIAGLKFLADTILEVINYIRSWMMMAAIALDGAIGAKPLTQAIKPQTITPGASANAATKGSTWSSIGDLGRNMASAVFATGMSPDMRTAENTARMADGIDQLVNGQNKQAQPKFDGNKPAPGLR